MSGSIKASASASKSTPKHSSKTQSQLPTKSTHTSTPQNKPKQAPTSQNKPQQQQQHVKSSSTPKPTSKPSTSTAPKSAPQSKNTPKSTPVPSKQPQHVMNGKKSTPTLTPAPTHMNGKKRKHEQEDDDEDDDEDIMIRQQPEDVEDDDEDKDDMEQEDSDEVDEKQPQQQHDDDDAEDDMGQDDDDNAPEHKQNGKEEFEVDLEADSSDDDEQADLSETKESPSTTSSSTTSTTPTMPPGTTAQDEGLARLAQDENATFESLGICKPLAEACAKMKWVKPSEIQRQVFPYALSGRDIIGLAETGSGKTGAFGLPMLQALLEKPQPLFGLILAPTRELAFQISEQLEALGSCIGVRVVTIVGGVDMMDQAIALAKKPHIIVASPGRIVDHLENTKGFHLRNLKFLILDEADRLLNMDFEKEIDKLLQVIPRDRRTYLFSATMTSKVAKLQRASLSNPVKVEVSKKYQTVKGLIQQYLFIPAKHKDCYLAYILNELAGQSMMIFTSTCEHTQKVAIMLRNLGFGAIPLHGKMSQPKRLGALNKFKSGERNLLIATDVASRGLDIPHVDVVINYDIPTHSKEYIHRVGRTARAGRSGRALTLVTQYDVELFQRIEKLLEKKLDLFPTEEDSVMVLLERVSEAQRIAAMELRDAEGDRKRRRKNGGGDDEEDEEGGVGAGVGAGAGPSKGHKHGGGGGGRGRGRGGSRGRGRGRGRGGF